MIINKAGLYLEMNEYSRHGLL